MIEQSGYVRQHTCIDVLRSNGNGISVTIIERHQTISIRPLYFMHTICLSIQVSHRSRLLWVMPNSHTNEACVFRGLPGRSKDTQHFHPRLGLYTLTSRHDYVDQHDHLVVTVFADILRPTSLLPKKTWPRRDCTCHVPSVYSSATTFNSNILRIFPIYIPTKM